MTCTHFPRLTEASCFDFWLVNYCDWLEKLCHASLFPRLAGGLMSHSLIGPMDGMAHLLVARIVDFSIIEWTVYYSFIHTLSNTIAKTLVHSRDQGRQQYHGKDTVHRQASWRDTEQSLLNETSKKTQNKGENVYVLQSLHALQTCLA